VAHPSWPASVCGVVYQGSRRATGCQFSFTCDGSRARRTQGRAWQRAQQIAQEALSGAVYAPIGHATHYHTLWVSPAWAKRLDLIGTIGAHHFYRQRGSAGEKAAFVQGYAGVEPTFAKAARASDAAPRIDPVPTPLGEQPDAPPFPIDAAPLPRERAASGYGPIDQGAQGLANPDLQSAGQAKEAFAKAGQWKVDPATLGVNKDDAAPSPAPAAMAPPPPAGGASAEGTP